MENKIDIIDKAENAIMANIAGNKSGNTPEITTTQLRKFLSAVNVMKNKVDVYVSTSENTEELTDELAGEIKFLKVTLAYMCGKDRGKAPEGVLDRFAKQTELEDFITSVGKDTKKFFELCKYVEALVAYHKYHGGKDK